MLTCAILMTSRSCGHCRISNTPRCIDQPNQNHVFSVEAIVAVPDSESIESVTVRHLVVPLLLIILIAIIIMTIIIVNPRTLLVGFELFGRGHTV